MAARITETDHHLHIGLSPGSSSKPVTITLPNGASIVVTWDSSTPGHSYHPAPGTINFNWGQQPAVDAQPQSEEVDWVESDVDANASELSFIPDDGEVYTYDPQEIRNKINGLVEAKEKTDEELQARLEVDHDSYWRFLLRYRNTHSKTYHEAHRYFLKREKRAAKAAAATAEPTGPPRGKPRNPLEVYLEGEFTGDVPVYDSCDTVRRKIQAHLREPGVTQTAFAREAAECLSNGRKFQSKQVSDFLRKKGPTGGAECGIYYGAYVFFEKHRIHRGDKKTKARLQAEVDFPCGRELKERRYMWVKSS
jgi:hypothetical protein